MRVGNYILIGVIFTIVLISGCVQTGPISPMERSLTLNVYGRLLEYTENNDTATFRIQQEIRDCELNKTEFIIQANISRFHDNLIVNNEYLFTFYKLSEDDFWQLIQVSNTFNNGSCSYAHEKDIVSSFVIKTTEPSQCPIPEPGCMTAVRLIPLVVTEGQAATIQIKLTNKQNNSLSYEINSSLLKFHRSYMGGPAYNGSPTDKCIATGLDSVGVVDPNSIKYLDILISCDNILSDLDFNETFADYFITTTLKFTDELGNEHEKTTDESNAFSFTVRPRSRCDAPDGKNYVNYEDLPIGNSGWREEIRYFIVSGFVLNPRDATFTEIDENQVVLIVDNPAATSLNPKITFAGAKPEIEKRVQIYGILDHGEFAAYKWCYIE